VSRRGHNHRITVLRLGTLVGSLALGTACGGGEDGTARTPRPSKSSAAPAAGIVAPARIEVIAGPTGCEAEIRIEADELREGLCRGERDEGLGQGVRHDEGVVAPRTAAPGVGPARAQPHHFTAVTPDGDTRPRLQPLLHQLL
jgi:hypothetical protein